MIKNLSALWPIITSLVLIVALVSVQGEKIKAMEVRQDKQDIIQEDVTEIKIKVGRIDERLEYLTNKRNK